jgi:hypothetical protein
VERVLFADTKPRGEPVFRSTHRKNHTIRYFSKLDHTHHTINTATDSHHVRSTLLYNRVPDLGPLIRSWCRYLLGHCCLTLLCLIRRGRALPPIYWSSWHSQLHLSRSRILSQRSYISERNGQVVVVKENAVLPLSTSFERFGRIGNVARLG